MKKSNSLLYSIILIFLIGFYSCDKEKLRPIVFLADEPGFQSKDTMLAVGDTIKILIDYTWNGKNLIDEIVLNVNDQLVGKYTISKNQGQFGVTIVKGLSDPEIWDIMVIDDAGNTAPLSLRLDLDPNSANKAIKYYDGIFLGAQSNLNRPGFMSLTHATYYNLDGAFQNQAKVDLFYYYNDTDKATLSAAGADVPDGVFSNLQAPGLWTVRNTTYFQKVDIIPEEFYGMYHDGFITENFDMDVAEKKASDLEVGDLYLFQLANGKKGILYVLTVEPMEDGLVSFAVKIQE